MRFKALQAAAVAGVAAATMLVPAGPAHASDEGVVCATGGTYDTCGSVFVAPYGATYTAAGTARITPLVGSSSTWRYGVDNLRLEVALSSNGPWVLDKLNADPDGPFYVVDSAITARVPCENFWFRATWHYTKVSPAGTVTASGTVRSEPVRC